jgi:hypothetical protein
MTPTRTLRHACAGGLLKNSTGRGMAWMPSQNSDECCYFASRPELGSGLGEVGKCYEAFFNRLVRLLLVRLKELKRCPSLALFAARAA